MTYEDILARAIDGRSVNSIAKEWKVQQVVLHRYLTGQRLPSFKVTRLIARAADISDAAILEILEREEDRRKLQPRPAP